MKSFRQKVYAVGVGNPKNRKHIVKFSVHMTPALADVILNINERESTLAGKRVTIGHTVRSLIGLGIHRYSEKSYKK